MNRHQAETAIRALGFEFDQSVTGKFGYTWMATIDAIGRRSIMDDCRGIAVHDHTATASEFWALCVKEAREHAGYLRDCPHAPGECDFHDDCDEELAA